MDWIWLDATCFLKKIICCHPQKLSNTCAWCTTRLATPLKIKIESKNHPIEKENHLPNLHLLGSMSIFQGFSCLRFATSRAMSSGLDDRSVNGISVPWRFGIFCQRSCGVLIGVIFYLLPGRLTAGPCPHGGLVQIIFLSFHGWFVGSSR